MAAPHPNSPGRRIFLSLLGLGVPVIAAVLLGLFGLFMMGIAVESSGRQATDTGGHAFELHYLAMIGLGSSGLLFGFAFVPPEPVHWLIQSGVIIASVSVLFSAGIIFHYLFTMLG